jgi:hypothetical protein
LVDEWLNISEIFLHVGIGSYITKLSVHSVWDVLTENIISVRCPTPGIKMPHLPSLITTTHVVIDKGMFWQH